MSPESLPQALIERRDTLRRESPQLRARDLAQKLGVSEAELLAVERGAVRLKPDWKALLAALPSLGRVMALTRNEAVVHERKGVYANFEWSPHAALFVGADIDLRLFPSQWAAVWALVDGDKPSIQVFDRYGVAVHKVHLLAESDVAGFDAIVAQFGGEEPPFVAQPAPAPPGPSVPDTFDAAAFQGEWDALRDTHAFFGLLRKHRIDRLSALRYARADQARPVAPQVMLDMLNAAKEEVPIMCFVNNRGCIQIHTGHVHNVQVKHGWTNVLDPHFNLHVRDSEIAQAFLVRKPTDDGLVTSLEFFDQHGELVVQFFGARKPGIPEDLRWRDLAERIGP